MEQICDEDASRDSLREPVERDGVARSFSQSHQMQIIELLGDWEDPEALPEHGLAPVEVSRLQSYTAVYMKNITSQSHLCRCSHHNSATSPWHQFCSFVSRLNSSTSPPCLDIILVPPTQERTVSSPARKVRDFDCDHVGSFVCRAC